MSDGAPLDAARSYIQRGWKIVPIPYREKAPRIPGWTTFEIDEQELPRYFSDCHMNIGIQLGGRSNGLIDIDLDCPEAVLLAPTFLPPTGARSGREGRGAAHWWYTVAGEIATRKYQDASAGAAERSMLLELRSTGCQTLAPPSVHPSGDRVIWFADQLPSQVTPDTLQHACGELAAAVLFTRRWPHEGQRHDFALALGGALLHGGWTAELAAAFVGVVAEAAGDDEAQERVETVRSSASRLASGAHVTGWPTVARQIGSEPVNTIRAWLGMKSSTHTDAQDQPRWQLPEPLPNGSRPPWPPGILPSPLAEFAVALAHATQTPLAMAAMLILAALATAAAKRVDVVIRDGWREPVNLFIAVILPPGNRKSAVVSTISEPLTRFEQEEAERLRLQIALVTQAREVEEKRLEQLKRKAANEEDPARIRRLGEEISGLTTRLQTDPALQPPRSPRLLVDDITPERLAALMAENGGRMAVMSAEGGIFQTIAGRYREKRGDSFDLFLKGHSGDNLPIDRVGRVTQHLHAPALTMALAIQPAVAMGVASEPGFRGTGLLARWLYGFPESPVGHRLIGAPPVPPSLKEAFGELITAILGWPNCVGPDGAISPRHIVFSAEADAALRAFEARLEPRLGPDGDLGHIADWGSKLAGAVARIAGLLHVAIATVERENPWEQALSRPVVESSIQLAEQFLIPHALTTFGEMGADPVLEAMRAVLRVIGRWPDETCNRRDLHRRNLKGRFPNPAALDAPLAMLVELGYLWPLPAEPRSGTPGRKPATMYLINPLWRARNLQNLQNSDGPAGNADSAENAIHSTDSNSSPIDNPDPGTNRAAAGSGWDTWEEPW